ncbi:Fatty acid transporter protein [Neolecta irregularis DAH-3]|uniref:Very long-chain fatty acid transport protein n=1 Tax=Neolecta irregularis (strain DAH-3) TaxID=1198029 RepID=A0A1U7LWD9_NEOID|nr:Fatty acid transporter protein [Neolecta irregularis DAH-3]|eukprot:OLL26996.1 Fatty acid transporter protein [Neolecta irregularis DAH-3]
MISSRRCAEKDEANIMFQFDEQVQKQPDTVFLVYRGREWTRKQTAETVLKVGNHLFCRTNGSDIVAIDFTNKPTMVFALMGVIAIGAWPAFLNYNLTGKSLVHCVKISNAKIILVDEEVASAINSVRSEITTDIYIYNTSRLNDQIIGGCSTLQPDTILRRGVEPSDTMLLIYTSGTTGLPKAAIMPYSTILTASKVISLWTDLKPPDRVYTCMPLYHASGLIMGLFSSLVAGTAFVLGHRFSTSSFWEEIRSSNATIVQYVGETCRYLLAAPQSHLDKCHNIRAGALGNGLRPDVWEKFRQRFGIQSILEFYATTEGIGGYFNYNTGPRGVGAVAHFGKLASILGKSRRAIVRLDFQTGQLVRGLDGFCVKVGTNETGELLVRVVVRAYYFKNKEASEKKIARDVFVKGDIYIRSGDALRVDEDGFYYFDDRIGDTFRWKGENVSTAQVSALLGTFPGILEANVYGISLPNHDEDIDLSLLSDYVKNHLPLFAIPVFLRFVKEMRITGNNKQLKESLRQEGADPAHTGGDRMSWFYNSQYVEFNSSDWQRLKNDKARL